MTDTSKTIANVRRDFTEWHRGRPDFVIWALDVDIDPVRQRISSTQSHLADWLLDDYRRQAHITLGLCGFACQQAQQDDDYDPNMLASQVAALQVAAPSAFELAIGGLGTFSSAPFLTVHDLAEQLPELRTCIASASINSSHEQYIPHVTVGLYRAALPMADVRQHLSKFDSGAPLQIQVEGINLMSYATRDIGGPLVTLARYDFRQATLQWCEPHQAPTPAATWLGTPVAAQSG